MFRARQVMELLLLVFAWWLLDVQVTVADDAAPDLFIETEGEGLEWA